MFAWTVYSRKFLPAKISQIHFSRKFPPAKITCYTVIVCVRCRPTPCMSILDCAMTFELHQSIDSRYMYWLRMYLFINGNVDKTSTPPATLSNTFVAYLLIMQQPRLGEHVVDGVDALTEWHVHRSGVQHAGVQHAANYCFEGIVH